MVLVRRMGLLFDPVRRPYYRGGGRPLSPPHAAPDFTLRATLAAAFGLATAPAAYAWVRALEAVMFPRVNPLAIVAVRCGVAAFVGGMGVFAGWWLAARPERGARGLVIAVVVAAAALALQAGVAP
jgi:hypothetical protein